MSYSIGGAVISDMSFTYSWGMSPASGNLSCVGGPSVLVGGDAVLSIGGSSFYGVLSNAVDEVQDGHSYKLSFVDNRIKLQWDDVYCLFNRVEVRADDPNTPGIDRQKRYMHILPNDWDRQIKSYTDAPYSAQEIIGFLFSAPTVAHAWSGAFDALQSNPVHEIDALTGKKLGNVLQEISDAQGLLFTLLGPSQLYWAQKGSGNLANYDPANTGEHSSGEAISSVDTRIRIVGDRNRYQDLSIDLEPDWIEEYEAFWLEPIWLDEVSGAFGLANTTFEDHARLAAVARKVTLREYCAVRGDQLADYGMWGEVGRMDVPVWTYLQDIVFKAYRVPADYSFNDVPLDSLELVEGLLCALNYSLQGALIYDTEKLYPDAKAYMLVQGQQLGLLDPTKQRVITEAELARSGSEWAPNNRFNLDTRNKVVIFEDAIFVPEDLFLFPNAQTDAPAALRFIAVPNANAKISQAEVKASLVWEAERYARVFGSGIRKGPHYVSGLGVNELFDGNSSQGEIPYADDEFADDKAAKIAESLIGQQTTFSSGGFKRSGATGTALTGSIDRVTISLNFSEAITETVEFSKERPQSNFENERDLERKQRARDLFPGQRGLTTDVETLEAIARIGKELKRSPVQGNYQSLSDVMNKPVGGVDCSVNKLKSPQTYDAGRPIFLNDDDVPDVSGNRFAGVVISHGATGSVAVATQGVVPTLVQGPFKKAEVVSYDGWVARPRMDNKKAFGVIESPDYDGGSVILAYVRLTRWDKVVVPPFHIEDVSVKGNAKVRVYFGTVNDETPAGMSDGDEPPYIIGVSDGQKVYLGVTWDTDSSSVTSCWIAVAADVPEDIKHKDGTYYKAIGSVHVDSSGTIPVVYCGDNISGSQHLNICRDWFSNPSVYSPSWQDV